MDEGRPQYRPMIEWYPEKRDELFERAAAHMEPDTLISKYFFPGVGAFAGFAFAAANAWIFRRPLMSGIQKYVFWTGSGLATGLGADKYYAYKTAERDAVMRHYIQLHPELFPVPKRITFGERFDSWVPVR